MTKIITALNAVHHLEIFVLIEDAQIGSKMFFCPMKLHFVPSVVLKPSSKPSDWHLLLWIFLTRTSHSNVSTIY
ncbi:hypothetical protein HMPREF2876_04845 [Streptococcus sp. HMSC073A12]|nr:hypothetical protein HMPREF2876_04845 [Streptococcus sp. HMSC073A12]